VSRIPPNGAGTLVERLADRAFVAPGEDSDRLRALALGNLAAGMGALGSAGPLIEAAAGRFDGSPGDAAYVNAMRLHARTQDDFSPGGRIHVGAIALASTLALADQAGDRMLDCLAAGYDAMGVVAAAYSPAAQAAGQRPSGMFGPFGAAASAAVALGLDRDRRVDALALAATMTGGTTQAWLSGTSEWLLEAGWAARAGVDAALLAQAGAAGSREAFEGGSGWCRAFYGDAEGEQLAAAVDSAGSRIAEVAAKPYPVSGIAQVPAHLACEAHRQLGGAIPRAVEVRLAPAEVAYPGSSNAGPFQGRPDALMSVAYCVACGLHDGTVKLDRLERAAAGELDETVARVRLVGDAALEEGHAIVTVDAGDGPLELEARDGEVLFPGWDELSADAEALAGRTECDPALVSDCVRALGADRPDARVVNEIWKGSAQWK
jgi:2-methylcitrate dehydratase PrpD